MDQNFPIFFQGQGGTDHIKLILEIFFDHSIIDSQSLQKIQKQKCLPDKNESRNQKQREAAFQGSNHLKLPRST